MLDLQRASLLKRLSAAIFDFILLIIAITGFACVIDPIIGFETKINELNGFYEHYEKTYNVEFALSQAELEALEPEVLEHYKEVEKIINADEPFAKVLNQVPVLLFMLITFSILFAYLLLEFAVPLLFKNGQTLGKKIFSVALMREDGVKITPTMLFIRTVLGKYTIGTMIPVFVALMILLPEFFGRYKYALTGIVIVAAIFIGQLILVFATKKHTAIHDKMAGTVAVDMQSQLIFKSPEELLKYKQKLHQEKIENTKS